MIASERKTGKIPYKDGYPMSALSVPRDARISRDCGRLCGNHRQRAKAKEPGPHKSGIVEVHLVDIVNQQCVQHLQLVRGSDVLVEGVYSHLENHCPCKSSHHLSSHHYIQMTIIKPTTNI